MTDDRPTELIDQVEIIVNQVANHDSERATQLVNELMSEYSTATVAAAILDISSDAINTVRLGRAELRTQTYASDNGLEPNQSW